MVNKKFAELKVCWEGKFQTSTTKLSSGAPRDQTPFRSLNVNLVEIDSKMFLLEKVTKLEKIILE